MNFAEEQCGNRCSLFHLSVKAVRKMRSHVKDLCIDE